MDRFSLETATLAGNPASYLKFWGELPPSQTAAVLECPNCKQDCDTLTFVEDHQSNMCPACHAEYLDLVAVEAVPAVIGSACCGASIRYERYSFGIDPETGYHDDGETPFCVACGNETEPEMVAVQRKPVVRAQGQLFNQEVA